ncbi:MAG: DUF1566 domain-containing protein [Proteobacteria bacterium]|nr:DUF1566 domain-containing protein [Pseudomonadota bacterium]
MPKTSTSESKEVKALKLNLTVTKGFLDLVKKIDSLPDMKKTTYDQTHSLYQAVSKGRSIDAMEKELQGFFGDPAKPVGKPMPLMLRFNPSIKYLDGIREEQVLFVKKVKAGFYYGALWPWKRDPQQITVHLGFCSHKMSDKDFRKLEDLVKSKILNERIFEEFDSKIGAKVHGLSLAYFLQMAAMEKITCTLKIHTHDKSGYLYLLNGELIDAETGQLKDKSATYNILSWDDAVIEIEKPSGKKDNKINQPVVQILTEALKIRDKEAPKKKKPAAPGKVQKKIALSDLEADTALQAEIEMAVDGDIEPVEKVPMPEKKRLLMITAMALVAVTILALGTVLSLRFLKSRGIKNEYNSILLGIENQQELKQKITILQNFVNAHMQSEYARKAEEKLKEIQTLLEEQDFNIFMRNADKLLASHEYGKAADVYREYLNKYPQSIHVDTVKRKITAISHYIDDGDYDALVKSADGDTNERIYSYFQYLKKHPEGKHRDEVNKVIADMAAEYYHFIKKELTVCGTREDWEKCVQLCDTFIIVYPDNQRANEIKRFQALSREKLKEKKILADLMLTAEQAGNDYKAAKQIYLDYLNSHADTPLKDTIIKEINKLQEQEELIRLQNETEQVVALLPESKGRFVANGNGTITDKKGGLTWCTLDSLIELKSCLDYESAFKYVKDLRTAGYTDWRLPTESELTGIYKTKPFFPLRKAEWYWTSKSYSRYSDGWHKMVYIVTTKRETEWKKEQADARECGAVHAVRP